MRSFENSMLGKRWKEKKEVNRRKELRRRVCTLSSLWLYIFFMYVYVHLMVMFFLCYAIGNGGTKCNYSAKVTKGEIWAWKQRKTNINVQLEDELVCSFVWVFIFIFIFISLTFGVVFFHLCLSLSLFVCLFACLFICLFVCLFICLNLNIR